MELFELPTFFAPSLFHILFPGRSYFSLLTVNLDCLGAVALCVIALLLTATHSRGSTCFGVRIYFCLSGFPIPDLHLSSL